MKFVVNGKKRKLVIDEAKMEDAGEIKAITNADEASCKLHVERKYKQIYFCMYFSLYYEGLGSRLVENYEMVSTYISYLIES